MLDDGKLAEAECAVSAVVVRGSVVANIGNFAGDNLIHAGDGNIIAAKGRSRLHQSLNLSQRVQELVVLHDTNFDRLGGMCGLAKRGKGGWREGKLQVVGTVMVFLR